MPLEEFLIRNLGGLLQALLRSGRLVSRNVVVIDIIRRGVHQQRHMRRARNAQLLVRGTHLAVADHPRTAFRRESAGDAFVLDALDARHERISVRRNLEGEFAVLGQCERQRPALARVEADDDGAVAHRGEGAPRIADAVRGEADPRDGAGQVQVTAIVIDLLRDVLEGHPETAQRQVPHAVRPGDELFVDQFFRFLLASVIDELADLAEIHQRCLAVVVVGRAAPESRFVQLDGLFGDTAENHRGHLAVAEGQGFQPSSGGRVIPQPLLVSGDLRPGGCHRHQRNGKKEKQFLHLESIVFDWKQK